jgi:hypothetical protein
MSKFKVGDRISAYRIDCGRPMRRVGVISQIHEDGAIVIQGHGYLFHPKACRRLKPKAKSVRVTREKLAEAWDEHLFRHGTMKLPSGASAQFDVLCRVLGLDGDK